jgi:hypothetical protein
MMLKPDLPGFSYDPAHATAVASLLRPLMIEATKAGVRPNAILAGLGLLCAEVIRGSGFRGNQEAAISALTRFVHEALTMLP